MQSFRFPLRRIYLHIEGINAQMGVPVEYLWTASSTFQLFDILKSKSGKNGDTIGIALPNKKVAAAQYYDCVMDNDDNGILAVDKGTTHLIHNFNESVQKDARTAQVMLPVWDGLLLLSRVEAFKVTT